MSVGASGWDNFEVGVGMLVGVAGWSACCSGRCSHCCRAGHAGRSGCIAEQERRGRCYVRVRVVTFTYAAGDEAVAGLPRSAGPHEGRERGGGGCGVHVVQHDVVALGGGLRRGPGRRAGTK